MTKPEKIWDTALAITGTLIWGIVLSTTAMETIEIFRLTPHASTDRVDEISIRAFWGMTQIYGLLCLWSEQTNQYHRHKARFARRMAWIIQAITAAVIASALGEGRDTAGVIVLLFFIAITAVAWRAWISTRALHPDDQKIVDRLVDEEQQLIDEAHQAQQQRVREAKLQAAVAAVSRPGTPVPAPANPVTWAVTRGQHDPVVYFIRNGNRIKIGTTTDLYQRIRRLALRTGDIALVLPGGRQTERSYHQMFAKLRVGNTEWFRDAEPLATFIAHHVQTALDRKDK